MVRGVPRVSLVDIAIIAPTLMDFAGHARTETKSERAVRKAIESPANPCLTHVVTHGYMRRACRSFARRCFAIGE